MSRAPGVSSKVSATLGFMAAALLLSATSHASSASQTVEWGKCDPALVDRYPELGDRLQCAELAVPRDHHDAHQGMTAVPMLRVLAGKPELRIGALFVNPGGPGAGATGFAAAAGSLFSLADPAHPVARLQREISDRYDIMGVEPRGLSSQWSFKCRSEIAEKPALPFGVDPSEANLANLEFNARLRSSACQGAPGAALINTDQTLRDLDVARAAVGESRLNYFGVSYGTWLGAWYAATFPKHVGRMLLDSNMNWTGTFDDATLAQPAGFQRAFEEVLVPYVSSRPEFFHLGSDPAGIIREYGRVRPKLRNQNKFWVLQPNNAQLDFSASVLSSTLVLERLLSAHPDAGLDETLGHIDRYFADIDRPVDESLIEFAKITASGYFRVDPAAPERPFELLESESVFTTVVCNDLPSQSDPAFWRSRMREAMTAYSVLGGDDLRQPCHDWALPLAPPRDFDAIAQTPGLLMLQGSHDPVTPAAHAMKAFDRTPNARMILVENNITHGLFPQLTDCVDSKVAQFLLNGVFPQRMSHCANELSSNKATHGTSFVQPYTSPDRAAELRQQMREMSEGPGRIMMQ